MCLIDALNLYVGGPLFDIPIKFIKLYASRMHLSAEEAVGELKKGGFSIRTLD
jgi:hypothetical protein